uniref:probable LRR receptor-like serine/threonine-protein kinase RFK1 isoform X1 n=1 Tax=Fragaria vesca subsp. vesca TaxID=101020 RepID=UPI0005C8BF4C|nr:PREDICTED: probable LRR receptor-like serine/threonine-protein kinase RFK1 isoform X1 [Fragaria vesca subsp. vesca]
MKQRSECQQGLCGRMAEVLHSQKLVLFSYVTVFVVLICIGPIKSQAQSGTLATEEVDALEEITRTMGAKYWKFNGGSCQIELVGVTAELPEASESSIKCECNNTVCHVVKLVLERFSLPGKLSPQLVKLPYLREIDLAYNYLSGTIPAEWGSMQLTSISLLVNRLSGEIPVELGNITTLTYLTLEANQFSGVVPPELGSLINLGSLRLSSNYLTGNIPNTFAGLRNLTDFRINDNNFNGTIPDFIQNWKQLSRLEIHGSGLRGPIPSNISLLSNLVELRISDINGTEQDFPMLKNMTGLIKLILRNCNISGKIPPYMWTLQNLTMLDVSFNKLIGEIPTTISIERLKFLFLTGNSLSGSIPDLIFKDGSSVDLSYNNFTWQGPERPACQAKENLNLNLFRSSSSESNLKRGLPCLKSLICPRYSTCLHVNCGGNDITVKENKESILYLGDGGIEGNAAENFFNDDHYWGFSSTGDFMDDKGFQNSRYSVSVASSNHSELYTTARRAPISLAYFHYCLENGNYTLSLHFAEIQFTNNQTFTSLGRRIFDIYIQDKLWWKDFNIEDQAKLAQTPVVLRQNISVTNNVLEIRFYFAGKGTTRIPDKGVYGPLVSAISVKSDFRPCSSAGNKGTTQIVIGLVVGALCLVFLVLGILWWTGNLPGCLVDSHTSREEVLRGLDQQTGFFTLRQMKAATNNFDPLNKIGEGGFGSVYKGVLLDGTVIAVKQLSSKSKQGNREFVNEIGMISCLQHPNLVRMYGCCIEANQLLLVYEYMENNSLARALYGPEDDLLNLDWPTRQKICVGIAKGLAYLHEESAVKVVHRDIKTTNVLLDQDLNAKISDFGLAKLDEEENTHISTRVAGTIGYMAPEYALWGCLTYKADVYSFGVVALETVSGNNNMKYRPNENIQCLMDWAHVLHQKGNLLELVDPRLGSDFNKKEALRTIKVALLCANPTAALRPIMSAVVSMLEGRTPVDEMALDPSIHGDEMMRLRAFENLSEQNAQGISSTSESHSLVRSSDTTSSDLYKVYSS